MSKEITKPYPGGAPRKYNRKKILVRLMNEMAKGERDLNSICLDDGMPDDATIYLWVSENTDEGRELYEIFIRAQQLWCWAQKAKCIQIADDDSKDVLETTESYIDKKGNVTTVERRTSDNTPVNRAKLRVAARQWAMAKLTPKIFGEKVEQQITGKDGERFQITVNVRPKVLE